jgi:hypothetical protein
LILGGAGGRGEGTLLLSVTEAFKIVDCFMAYRVYKISEVLGIVLIVVRECPEETGNGAWEVGTEFLDF